MDTAEARAVASSFNGSAARAVSESGAAGLLLCVALLCVATQCNATQFLPRRAFIISTSIDPSSLLFVFISAGGGGGGGVLVNSSLLPPQFPTGNPLLNAPATGATYGVSGKPGMVRCGGVC